MAGGAQVMGQITVRYLNVFADLAERQEESVSFDRSLSLGELIGRLKACRKPAFRRYVLEVDGRLKPHVWILVNRARVKDPDRQMADGEVVVFSLPIMGG